jgi:hypothetical protein
MFSARAKKSRSPYTVGECKEPGMKAKAPSRTQHREKFTRRMRLDSPSGIMLVDRGCLTLTVRQGKRRQRRVRAGIDLHRHF